MRKLHVISLLISIIGAIQLQLDILFTWLRYRTATKYASLFRWRPLHWNASQLAAVLSELCLGCHLPISMISCVYCDDWDTYNDDGLWFFCRSCVSGVRGSSKDESDQRPHCLDSRQCSWTRRRRCWSASWVSIDNQFSSLTLTASSLSSPQASCIVVECQAVASWSAASAAMTRVSCWEIFTNSIKKFPNQRLLWFRALGRADQYVLDAAIPGYVERRFEHLHVGGPRLRRGASQRENPMYNH